MMLASLPCAEVGRGYEAREDTKGNKTNAIARRRSTTVAAMASDADKVSGVCSNRGSNEDDGSNVLGFR